MLLLKFQLGREGLLVYGLFVEKRVNMAGSVGFFTVLRFWTLIYEGA
jgi:hypothetical protein